MLYPLVVCFAAAFVLALCWFTSKTIGKLAAVKKSPTLDDFADLLYRLMHPGLAKQRAVSRQQHCQAAEELPEPVRALADKGDILGATKARKEATGARLEEAKAIIDLYFSNQAKE